MAMEGCGSREEGDESLARALHKLELQEEEMDYVVVEDQDLANVKTTVRWLAVARVHTSKRFRSEALFETLDYVWGLAMEE
jgi:hypothetical protein